MFEQGIRENLVAFDSDANASERESRIRGKESLSSGRAMKQLRPDVRTALFVMRTDHHSLTSLIAQSFLMLARGCCGGLSTSRYIIWRFAKYLVPKPG